MRTRSKLYLASPLFNDAERRLNAEICERLSEWYEVFLPQEDGELMMDLINGGMPVDQAKMTVFRKDHDAVKACDILLIVLDGRAIDEGAAFELGMAFAYGKDCWGLKTDVRQLLRVGDNPMVEGALRHRFSSVASLVEFASEAARAKSGTRDSTPASPYSEADIKGLSYEITPDKTGARQSKS